MLLLEVLPRVFVQSHFVVFLLLIFRHFLFFVFKDLSSAHLYDLELSNFLTVRPGDDSLLQVNSPFEILVNLKLVVDQLSQGRGAFFLLFGAELLFLFIVVIIFIVVLVILVVLVALLRQLLRAQASGFVFVFLILIILASSINCSLLHLGRVLRPRRNGHKGWWIRYLMTESCLVALRFILIKIDILKQGQMPSIMLVCLRYLLGVLGVQVRAQL